MAKPIEPIATVFLAITIIVLTITITVTITIGISTNRSTTAGVTKVALEKGYCSYMQKSTVLWRKCDVQR